MKTMKVSVNIADDPPEIRSGQLPNTNLSLHKSVHQAGRLSAVGVTKTKANLNKIAVWILRTGSTASTEMIQLVTVFTQYRQ
jgi:hypothetical protein